MDKIIDNYLPTYLLTYTYLQESNGGGSLSRMDRTIDTYLPTGEQQRRIPHQDGQNNRYPPSYLPTSRRATKENPSPGWTK